MRNHIILSAVIFSVLVFTHTAHADITTGLVGHWKLDGNAGDSTVYANNGRINGGASFTAGNIGQALSFDGSDDYISIENAFDLTNTVTYAFWVKPSGVNWRAIVGNGVNDEGIFLDPSEIVWAPPGVSSVSALTPGAWNHVVVTMAGGTTKIYIAGVLDAQDNSELIFDVRLIGADREPLVDETFSGELDDIRIYNRELSGADVAELFALSDPSGTTGTINVQATLDGAPWFGPGTINYEISGPTTFSGDFDLPIAHANAPEGLYTINVPWPGDWPGVFKDAAPASTFYLNGGEDITFTLEFVTCPILPQAGRIIFNPYNDIGSPSYAPYIAGPYDVSISAGTYDVTVVSFDNHSGPNGTGGQGQPNEKLFLKLFNSSGLPFLDTGSTQDIPDDEDIFTTLVNTSLVIPQDVSSIEARHSNYIDDTDYNSLAPVCALFTPVGSTATCGDGIVEFGEECEFGPGDFTGWWRLDEGSGTTASDYSGNGYNGTLISGPIWVAGLYGEALSFDDNNDRVSMGQIFDNNGTQPVTLGAWIKTTDSGGPIMTKALGFNGGYKGYGIHINGFNGRFEFVIRESYLNNEIDVVGTTQINDNVWHHVMATYDGSKNASGVKLYVDGNLETNSIVVNAFTLSSSNNGEFQIGRRGTNDLGSTIGAIIDDARIYNRVLTASEVAAIYNADLGGASCVSEGFSGGILSCNASTCQFDESQCTMDDDYLLTASPQGVIATITGSKNVDSSPTTIRITQIPAGGFTGNISLTSDIASVIPGATHDFSDTLLRCNNPPNCDDEYMDGSVLTFNIPENVAAGEYTVTVTGSGGGLPDHTVFPALKINVLIKDPGFEEVLRPIKEWFAGMNIPFAEAFSTK